MMTREAEERKAERLDAVAEHLRSRHIAGSADLAESFIHQYYDRVLPEDVIGTSPDSLYASAYAFWKFGQKRRRGKARVRVFNPTVEEHGWTSHHTIVETITDDMPFLLDSLLAELNRSALGVHLIIHPIFELTRDGAGKLEQLFERGTKHDALLESWMHVEIDAQSSLRACKEIEDRIKRVLSDARAAVEDWQPMMRKLEETVAELDVHHNGVEPEEFSEARSFLDWIADNHFTFLGYREYSFKKGAKKDPFQVVEGSGLGVLRNPDVHVLNGNGAARKSKGSRAFLESVRAPLMVTKTSARSTVHRPAHMDYIGIKRLGSKGELTGEHRFVGLFTSSAYNRSARDIPLLRRKVMKTVERSGYSPVSHDGKALINILETFPRDELFQIPEDELSEIANGILHLLERPRIKLFVRREQFDRYVSCLIYVPREIHTTQLRKRFENILETAFDGKVTDFSTEIGESPLARIHIIVGLGDGAHPEPDVAALERDLVDASRSWDDDLRDALVEHVGEERGKRLHDIYRSKFSGAYCESFVAKAAVADITIIETLSNPADLALNMYRPIEAPANTVRFKIYHAGSALALSDCLPMLENMGLKVVEERPYEIKRGDNFIDVWLHDLLLTDAVSEIDLGAIKDRFQDTFAGVWRGEIENDGFNQLVLRAGLTWREAVILRAYGKYLRQTGTAFSQSYIQETLAANPAIARLLVDLFHARFDPAQTPHESVRPAELSAEIEQALEDVANLDQDRILRSYMNLITVTLRTNFYQDQPGAAPGDARTGGKPYVSFKIDSAAVDDLPLPRPYAEIWVYSPRVEAVHLRGGMVARGGIRWSDRREDFRTEVLGLMKAQMVKNAVIVPVGSKGGFVTKQLPAEGGREAVMDEVVACYRTMMQGMFDLTDNYDGTEVVPPPQVERHDGDDPYLVVAADKGTATFSDIANEIAESYGFWLGDAYASGGSAGYDHKKMGITARGCWESVKRHFRELGLDTQREDFTVLGVGDMSGDVFGNGMLLSKHIRLIAAFNHLHIFLDPDPDAAASFAERRRLFETPGTTWADYNPDLISEGGGVFERRVKSIALSKSVQAALGTKRAKMTPAELIRTILKAEADLLWLGGIGTYVRAHDETDAEVGDRASDSLRITAKDLRCRVVGEGANLGFTQRARIEFARKGGRINTDAIDNSAGVDASDHEVNIKILLGSVVSDGEMTRKQRDRVLRQMTDEVASLVLRDNYLQTQSISLAQTDGAGQMAAQVRFMRSLERAGRLDRALEFLPDDEAIAERMAEGRGLTRPEVAVLLSYAKTTLFQDLLDSDVPEDPYLESDLIRYFPEPVREPYVEAIRSHRLRRELIATHVANNVINRAGITFVSELMEETGLGVGPVTRAYLVSREAFAMRPLWAAVEALDNKVSADFQATMILELMELVRQATLWFARNLPKPLEIAAAVVDFAPGIEHIWLNLESLHTETTAQAIKEASDQLVSEGVPHDLAVHIAGAENMGAACHIVQAAKQIDRPVDDVARTYFALGATLGLDWLRDAARALQPKDHWERLAVAAIVEDLYGQQRAITRRVYEGANGADGEAAIDIWVKQHPVAVERTSGLISEFKSAGGIDIARLAIANRHVRNMIVD